MIRILRNRKPKKRQIMFKHNKKFRPTEVKRNNIVF